MYFVTLSTQLKCVMGKFDMIGENFLKILTAGGGLDGNAESCARGNFELQEGK